MRKIIQGMFYLCCGLLLVSCAKAEPRVEKTVESSVSAVSEAAPSQQESDFYQWFRHYQFIDRVDSTGTTGYFFLNSDNTADFYRNEAELTALMNKKGLAITYTIKKYQGEQEVASYSFPSLKTNRQIIKVRPEVQLDFTTSKEEIERVGTDRRQTEFTFYGYKTSEGHLILTDGNAENPEVYVYRMAVPQMYRVGTAGAAIRLAPKFDADIIEEKSADDLVTSPGLLLGQEKEGNKWWLDVTVGDQTGYVWFGDVDSQPVGAATSSDSSTVVAEAETESSSMTVESSNTEPSTSPEVNNSVNVEQILQADFSSLTGTWVNSDGFELLIDGGLVQQSGPPEVLVLAEQAVIEQGIRIDRRYRSVNMPVLLIPKGQSHGQSDVTKDRLIWYYDGEEVPSNQYFYKK